MVQLCMNHDGLVVVGDQPTLQGHGTASKFQLERQLTQRRCERHGQPGRGR